MARLRQPLLVVAASALLLAAGMGEENPAPVPPAAAPAARPQKPKPDVVPGDNPRVDLEVDARLRLMLAPVTVNGVEGRFVLGTGVPTTLVTPDFAGKTGLDRTAVSVGVVGGGEDAKLSRVQSLKVGATNFANFDIRILALENISKHLDRPPDGVLGADVLLALPLTLDHRSRRLVFGRPSDLSGRKELPADIFARHLVVPGDVEGEKVEFIIDTGATLSTIAKSSYRGKTEKASGLEFAVPREVRLGDMALESPRFLLDDQNILGIDFFQRYVVTLDAMEKKVYVHVGAMAQALPAAQPSRPPAGATPPAANPPGAPPATGTPAGDPTPATTAKPLPAAIEKQLADFPARLMALQEEEYKMVNKIMVAQQKALDSMGLKPEDIEDSAARSNKPIRDYKAMLVGFVQQLQAFDAKYVAIQRQLRVLEADRRAADAKPRITQLATQVVLQRKSLHDKMADLCEKAGDYKAAIAIYEAEVQTLNELKRPVEARLVKEKLADAYDKTNDPKKAATTLRSIYDAIPPAERSQVSNINFMLRLGFMYEKANDSRKALEIYEVVAKVCPANVKLQGLSQKIAALKSKVGNTQ
ncbi:MAG: aspartyl protease family protein [Planctomycetota bacterium]|nr:aspartyl protease family protein [Planctomycetota bacterium]